MIVVENIRPSAHVPEQPTPWFVVIPDTMRQAITKQLAILSGQPDEKTFHGYTRYHGYVLRNGNVLADVASLARASSIAPVDLPRLGLVLVSSTDAKSLVLILDAGFCAVCELTAVAGSFGAELDLLFAFLVSLPHTESESPRQ